MKKSDAKSSKRVAPGRDVDGYLAALSPEIRNLLTKLRAQIKAAAPEAEETISYQIPTYKCHGPLVHFAAFKHHCSFYGVSKGMLATFRTELAPYEISGTTIHFTADHPLPASLVKKMVKARLKENELRAKGKSH